MKFMLGRLHCHKWTLKGNSGESPERKESCTENLNILRKYINNPEQNINRNMDDKGHPDGVSDGNEEYVIGNWRKGD